MSGPCSNCLYDPLDVRRETGKPDPESVSFMARPGNFYVLHVTSDSARGLSATVRLNGEIVYVSPTVFVAVDIPVTLIANNLIVVTLAGAPGSSLSLRITGPQVNSITLSPATTSLFTGATTALTANVAAEPNADLSLTWSSSNPTVATVDANGMVTAVAAGVATIQAVSQLTPSVSGSAIVTVVQPTVHSVTVQRAGSGPIIVGESAQLSASVIADPGADASVTWSSSEAIATVSTNGLVSGVSAGSTNICAQSVLVPAIQSCLTLEVLPPPVPLLVSSVKETPGRHQIYSVNEAGVFTRLTTSSTGNDFDPKWSPDKSRIAFQSSRSGSRQIWVMNANGSNPEQLTFLGENFGVAWSADGSQLAFGSNRDGQQEIYVMNSATGANQTNVSNSPGQDYDPSWSPVAARIAWSRNLSLWTMDADGSDKTQLTTSPTQDYRPSWSPDGTKIAFARPRSNPFDPTQDIWVIDVPASGLGTGLTRLTFSVNASYSPTWSPDGATIAFASNRSGIYQVFRMNSLDGTAVSALTPSTFETYGPNWR